MKGRNLLIGAASAAGAFAVALAVLAPATLNATEPVRLINVMEAIPNTPLVVDGVEINLRYVVDSQPADVMKLDPDAPVKVNLIARNSSDESVELEATITIWQRTLASPRSRILPIASEVWKQSKAIALPAGETHTIVIAPDVKAKKGTMLAVEVSFGGKESRSLRFSIPSDDVVQLRNGQ